MKRIVICFDGTWNALTDPSAVTNVVRVGQAVLSTSEGCKQVVYYNAGVGSGGPIDQFLGGVFGVGLRNNVKRGLAYLTLNWEKGDEIYIFGFSRGAYTARALAGVITAIGGIPNKTVFHRLEDIWQFYRLPFPERRKTDINKKLGEADAIQEVPGFLIKCLAVWDTVGSYGVPAGLGLGGLARRWTSWTRGFHDNVLHRRIEVALQALAIDEARRAFPATTWLSDPSNPVEGQKIEQTWFAGAHSNVGGGYGESGLSDMALIWMMAKIEEYTPLRFNRSYIARNFWPCSACSLYQSNRGWWLSSVLPSRRAVFAGPTEIELWDATAKRKVRKQVQPANEKVHWSTVERLGRDAIVDEKVRGRYLPRNLPADWEVARWSEERRAGIEGEERRVTRQSKIEAQFIALCRNRENTRFHNCALFCDFSKQESNAGILSSLRNILSSQLRRDRRMQRLRRIWEMRDSQGM